MALNVVGVSAFSHESACCLLRDGDLIAAAEEERFTRIKHESRLPVEAFRYCLREAKLGIRDVDVVAYYESPRLKLERQLWAGVPAGVDAAWLDAGRIERLIRESLGHEGEVVFAEHHASHAASAFFFSGFPEAALLTVDGVGEWATTAYGEGGSFGIRLFEEVVFPDSIGLLYSTVTAFLGFRVNDGEYKVMGLAPYGRPAYVDRLSRVLRRGSGGQYSLDLRYFDFVGGTRMFSDAFADLVGFPPRAPRSELTQAHRDLARSVQELLEEVLLEKARYLHGRVPSERLCMAGGVALNAVANGRIRREGPFAELFIQPAAGDAGAALGAAALASFARDGRRPDPMRHAAWGPGFSNDDVFAVLAATGHPFADHRGDESALIARVVEALAAGKIVGWFHGRMEFGPRALGGRSILASPLDPTMRDRLNRVVKKREAFRPFAPSVVLAEAGRHFELEGASPFMLEVCRVSSQLALPAVTHVDGSARPQTVDPESQPRFGRLLAAFFARTGCPMLVNTSFNVADDPIVCTPADAILTLAIAGLDLLVLEDFVLERDARIAALELLVRAWDTRRSPRTLNDALYTFV